MHFCLSLLLLLSTFSSSSSYVSSLSVFDKHHHVRQSVIQQGRPLLDGVLIEPAKLNAFQIDTNIAKKSTLLLLQQHQQIDSQQQQQLEHELEMIMAEAIDQEHQQDVLVGGDDHIPDDAGLEKGIASLTEARKVLRKADDPIDAKTKLVVVNNFLYKLDGDGRPLWARGMVARKKRSPKLSDAANQMADVMYYHSNKKDPREGKKYNTGHIIASALGGSDTDPMNFFPQHCDSNSRGGVWWRLEMIAGHIKDTLSAYKITSTCHVMITVQLDYDIKQWKWMPIEGYYYIELNEACARAFVAITQKTSYGEVGKQLINELIIKRKIVKNTLSSVIGGRGVDGFRFIYKWYNKYDKADPKTNKMLFKS